MWPVYAPHLCRSENILFTLLFWNFMMLYLDINFLHHWSGYLVGPFNTEDCVFWSRKFSCIISLIPYPYFFSVLFLLILLGEHCIFEITFLTLYLFSVCMHGSLFFSLSSSSRDIFNFLRPELKNFLPYIFRVFCLFVFTEGCHLILISILVHCCCLRKDSPRM